METTANTATATPDQTRRILSAIADCDRYINKEEGRGADLRPREIQERLAWYYAHRTKLQAMMGAR